MVLRTRGHSAGEDALFCFPYAGGGSERIPELARVACQNAAVVGRERV